MKLFYFLIPCLVLFSCGQQTGVGVSKEENTHVNRVSDTLRVNEKLDILAAKMNIMSGMIDSLTLLNQNQAQEIYLLKLSVKGFQNSNNTNTSQDTDQERTISRLVSRVDDNIKVVGEQISDLYSKIKEQDDRLMGKSSSYSTTDALYNLKEKIERFENKIHRMESDISDLKRAR